MRCVSPQDAHPDMPLATTTTKVSSKKTRTPAEAREWLVTEGISINDFARRHGLTRFAVSDALRGRSKSLRGAGHRAAVALGIKPQPQAKQLEEAL